VTLSRTARRTAGFVAALTLAAFGVPSSAWGEVAAKKAKLNQPCTFLSRKEVAKQFGSPVADPTLDAAYLSCKYVVGADAQAPGGTLAAVQLWPNYLQHTNSAKAAYEDEHAVDTLAQNVLSDVDGLGRGAYMNLTKGTLVVLATKKFMFTLTWTPAPATPLTAREIKKLTTLAKLVVPRSPV
jgi:hypothetical protein